ncbi:MAG TPA: DUF6055 domain-containing protein [Fibrobacteraceae bacterium]|nr:DUF6055 domain-containing protein [Fibrobacteraceae bacterium]
MALLWGSVFAETWVSRTITNETVLDSSTHFDIRKKAYLDDGTTNTVTAPGGDSMETGLNYLESVWSTYIDDIGFVIPEEDSTTKHRIRVYLYPASIMSGLYGGADDYGAAMWIGPGALLDHWGLAHEFTHGLQSLSGGMQGTDYGSWVYESHANWMAHQEIPSNTHCSEMLVDYPYLYYGSTRDRYCNWQFLEYLKDQYGYEAVNEIWTNSLRAGVSGASTETPMTALMRNKSWSVSDLNDQFGLWAMHNVTWDYNNGAVYRSSYGSYSDRTSAIYGPYRDRVTMLDSLDANNRYFSPPYWAPQPYGYNLVRIYPDTTSSNSTITVKFRGVVQTSPYNSTFASTDSLVPSSIDNPNSDWRWGLVAVASDSSARYSALQSGSAADMTFDVKSTDLSLWMVVVATPSVYTHIFWDQMYYTIYRYPWMVEFTGAQPEGYEDGHWDAPSGTSCKTTTSNWLGCVASTATVASTVYVGPNAKILGNSTVSGTARIEDYAIVKNATVKDSATIRDQAWVYGGTVSGGAVVEGHAYMTGGTVSGTAHVGALSYMTGGTVSGTARLYSVMNSVSSVTISGTAQMLGDMELYTDISSGVYYGMVDATMATYQSLGASRTDSVAEVTAPPPYYWPSSATLSSSTVEVSSAGTSSSDGSSSAVSSSSSTVSSSSSTNTGSQVLEGENYCEANGTIDSNNSGFQGSGYLNITNEVGTSAMWAVTASAAGTYTMGVLYSNGTSADRPVSVAVNGTIVLDSLSFPALESWTTWDTVTTNLTLIAGRNEITLTSLLSAGGPNIDEILFYTSDVLSADCDATTLSVNQPKISVVSAQWLVVSGIGAPHLISPVNGRVEIRSLNGSLVWAGVTVIGQDMGLAIQAQKVNMQNGVYAIRWMK